MEENRNEPRITYSYHCFNHNFDCSDKDNFNWAWNSERPNPPYEAKISENADSRNCCICDFFGYLHNFVQTKREKLIDMIDIFAIVAGSICLLYGTGLLKLKNEKNLTEEKIRAEKRKLIICGIVLFLCAIAKFLINKGYL